MRKPQIIRAHKVYEGTLLTPMELKYWRAVLILDLLAAKLLTD